MNQVTRVKLASIIVDQRTQQRPLNAENVARLTDLLRDGGKFDTPIEVFFDAATDEMFLGHGHHRYHAYQNAGTTNVEVSLAEGTLDDAIDHSCRPLNAGHGQPETREDRERRVKKFIERKRHTGMSNVEMAEWCGVSEFTIRNYKQQMPEPSSINIEDARTVTRGGKTYEMNTANIGRKSEKSAEVVDTNTGEVLDDVEIVTTTTTSTNPGASKPTHMPAFKQAQNTAVGVWLHRDDPARSYEVLRSHFNDDWLNQVAALIAAHSTEASNV